MDFADKLNDLSFYCAARWLSSSDVFYRFVELLEPIKSLLIEKKKTFETLDDMSSSQNLLFLTDAMQHLQSLNLSLQEKEKYIYLILLRLFLVFKKITLFQGDFTLKTFNSQPKMIISNL